MSGVSGETPESTYHHGNLPTALRAAAAQLIHERGPAGFSLREVARRAGVSHAAPSHHFGDVTGLLTSIAVEAFQHLARSFHEVAIAEDDPRLRLRRQAQAYVRIGREYPGHCAVVFRHDLVNRTDPEYLEWGDRAYSELEASVRALRDQLNPDLDVDDASRLCWSTMQGLLALYDSMAGHDELFRGGHGIAPIDEMAATFADLIIDGLV